LEVIEGFLEINLNFGLHFLGFGTNLEVIEGVLEINLNFGLYFLVFGPIWMLF
jgi:hypothetical protein